MTEQRAKVSYMSMLTNVTTALDHTHTCEHRGLQEHAHTYHYHLIITLYRSMKLVIVLSITEYEDVHKE